MWLDLLRAAVAGSSQAQVARELGVSATAVSLLLAEKYPARTDKLADRVLLRYGRIHCPYLDEEIAFSACRDHHDRPAPTSSPFAMRHWRACQSCAHNKLRRAA
jgi:hypothetical protein